MKTKRIGTGYAWFMTFVSALFFFFSFFQVNMMTALNQPLSAAFHTGAAQIGLLSAWFFYANIIFMIPAGLIADRMSVKWIMIITMIITVIGTFILAYSTNIYWASIARFINGIQMSFGLIACIKLASLVLPSKHMALASSIIVTIGMVGGVCANLVFQDIINHLGYQTALVIVALFGILVALIIWVVIRLPKQKEKKGHAKISIGKSLLVVIKEKQNWLGGFFTCFLNLPLVVFGALFGISYLQQVYGFENLEAASIVSMLFIGMIFGSPFFGWLSDFMKQRRIPMAIGGVLCLVCVFLLIYFTNLDTAEIYLLFFAIGFTSAAQVLSYPMIAESNSLKYTGSALAIASILIIGIGYGASLPLVGSLLEWGWTGQIFKGMHDYSLHTYRNAFLTIPIGIIIGLILIAFMRETKGKQTR